ncbi:MAG: hypothetical protein WC501_03210 [Candidatus Micrarchaeia archaeon]
MPNYPVLKEKGHTINVDKEILSIAEFFGIDPKKEKLAFTIFLYLLDSSLKNKGIKTIDIAKSEKTTQAAVVYHLNYFIGRGFVIKKRREYFLIGKTLTETIDEMVQKYLQNSDKMRKIAKIIDEHLIS